MRCSKACVTASFNKTLFASIAATLRPPPPPPSLSLSLLPPSTLASLRSLSLLLLLPLLASLAALSPGAAVGDCTAAGGRRCASTHARLDSNEHSDSGLGRPLATGVDADAAPPSTTTSASP
jgi:hypothetical protein